jgi:hypothetical protein
MIGLSNGKSQPSFGHGVLIVFENPFKCTLTQKVKRKCLREKR